MRISNCDSNKKYIKTNDYRNNYIKEEITMFPDTITQNKVQKITPVNTKSKDTFFKKIYETEKRQKELTSFLLGMTIEEVSIANVRPVLFGNKENDFACLCDDIFYILTEERFIVSPNMPYLLLEYVTAGLRSMIDNKQIYLPFPRLYTLQVGLEKTDTQLQKKVQYNMHLSDSYKQADKKYSEDVRKPDLDVTVHVYDFRMTLKEILSYIEEEKLPKRFDAYHNDVRNYALVANGITYMQRIKRDSEYILPKNISTVSEYLKLMLNREIFVDLLSNKEICDMTMAQFSRDDILIYQGREEGIEEGKTEMIQELLLKNVSIDIIAQCAKMDVKHILEIQNNMIENGQL